MSGFSEADRPVYAGMLGAPSFYAKGEELPETESARYLPLLRTGFLNHENAARHWDSWT